MYICTKMKYTVFSFHPVFLPAHWTVNDLHPVSSRLHQFAVWQSVSDDCSQISVFFDVSDVPAALPAADWSQTRLHPQPAVLPGSHTDQVTQRSSSITFVFDGASLVSWSEPAHQSYLIKTTRRFFFIIVIM